MTLRSQKSVNNTDDFLILRLTIDINVEGSPTRDVTLQLGLLMFLALQRPHRES